MENSTMMKTHLHHDLGADLFATPRPGWLQTYVPGGRVIVPDWQFGSNFSQGWKRLLHLPPSPLSLDLSEHSVGVLFGTTPQGIDMSLLRLATNAARHCWKVILFDAMGSKERAATFLAAMQYAGLQKVRVFPHAPFDGWRGTPEQISQRLLHVASFDSAPSLQHLAAILLPAFLSEKRVSGLGDLVSRFTDLLQQRSSSFPQHTAVHLPTLLQSVPRYELVELALRCGTLATLLGSSLDGEWSFEDASAAYLSFNALTHPRSARTQATLLLADLARYLTESGRQTEHVLLLIQHPELLFDLEQQLAPLLATTEQVGMRVFLAVSRSADLGYQAHRILAYAQTILLHRGCAGWSDLAPYVSVPRKLVPSVQTLAQLPDDECFVISNGVVRHARLDPVGIPMVSIRQAYTSLFGQAAQATWEGEKQAPHASIFLFDLDDLDLDDLDLDDLGLDDRDLDMLVTCMAPEQTSEEPPAPACESPVPPAGSPPPHQRKRSRGKKGGGTQGKNTKKQDAAHHPPDFISQPEENVGSLARPDEDLLI
jgi:hypothetical protein